jgi:hypothetical protein
VEKVREVRAIGMGAVCVVYSGRIGIEIESREAHKEVVVSARRVTWPRRGWPWMGYDSSIGVPVLRIREGSGVPGNSGS